MTEKPSVAEALSAVMGDVQAVGKTGFNKAQSYSFRGVDAVVNAVGPAFRKHGVVCLPRVLSKEYSSFATKSGTLMHQALLEVEFTFVGPAGDHLTCSTMGESASADDKGSAKAHSVAYRTALLQALCIPTDETDPDEYSFERAAPPASMTSRQHEDISKALAALAEGQADELKAWWRTQRFPKKEHLNQDQADQVLMKLDDLKAQAEAVSA